MLGRWRTAIGLAVSLALLVWVATQVSFTELWVVLRTADVPLLIANNSIEAGNNGINFACFIIVIPTGSGPIILADDTVISYSLRD